MRRGLPYLDLGTLTLFTFRCPPRKVLLLFVPRDVEPVHDDRAFLIASVVILFFSPIFCFVLQELKKPLRDQAELSFPSSRAQPPSPPSSERLKGSERHFPSFFPFQSPSPECLFRFPTPVFDLPPFRARVLKLRAYQFETWSPL